MSIYSIKDGCDESYLRNHLENYCREANITEAEFSIDRCSKKGDNFIGLVYRVTIDGKVNGKNETVHAVLKLASRSEERRKLVPSTRPFFLREIFFFRVVVPLFQQADVQLHGVPKLLYANDEDRNEALILEDLSVRGFCSMRKEKGSNTREAKLMDYNHASLALQCLGEFHANSFIVREKRPDIFQKLQAIKEPLFLNLDRHRTYVDLLFKIMKVAFDEDANEYQKMKFKLFNDNFFNYLQFAVNGENAEPYAVVCHGDFWSGNMLFKYEEDSLCPKDFYFLDFQICRYTSPITDISYMLFCCCQPHVRQDKFDDLLKIYHNSLTNTLESAGLNSSKIFSYDIFLQEVHKFASFAGVMTAFVAHLFTTGNNDVVPEIGKSLENYELLKTMVKNNDVYRNQIKNIYYDLIDKHFI